MKVSDNKLTPQLRFPEFENSGEWEEKKLGEISSIVKEKLGKNNYTLLSITAGHGLVSQLEKFGKEIAGSSYENYIVIHKNDFAYNKSATKDYQSGYVALLKTYDVAAVPNSIFLCFRIDETILNVFFLEQLFKFNYHDKYLRKLIQIGARAHGSLNISNKDFFSIPIPIPPLKEQQKIADFFSLVDELIDNEKIKLENLKEYKKGLLQNLFPKENQKVPDLRFPEFKNSGEWEEKKLGDILVESRIPGSQGSIAKKISLKLWGKGVTIKKENILGSNNTKYYIRKKGQFIYSKLDFLNQAFAIIPDEFDGFETTTDLPCFDVSKLINKFFLLEFIKLPNIYKTYGVLFANGGRKAKRVQVKDFLKIKILVPIYKEQQKIADFLSSVEKLIIEQVEKIQLLQEYKKGLLQKLFL